MRLQSTCAAPTQQGDGTTDADPLWAFGMIHQRPRPHLLANVLVELRVVVVRTGGSGGGRGDDEGGGRGGSSVGVGGCAWWSW